MPLALSPPPSYVQVEETGPKEWVSFLKPNLTITMVDHFVTYPKTNIPPPVSEEGSEPGGSE